MSVLIATSWYPSSSLYSGWLAMVAVISALACYLASFRRLHLATVGQLFVIVGTPILFITVLFSEAGMFILRDGREFGFPIGAWTYPNACDFLATYIALGASYLMAREATWMSVQAVRVIGWIEVAGFVSLAAFELFLLGRRIYAC